MITSSDFVRLPYTPDLTEGGIAYTTHTLPYSYDNKGKPSFSHLRRSIARVAVELAFRRFLNENKISFEVRNAMPFSDPDRYDVTLGKHRCDIKSFLITHRHQISSLNDRPELLLEAPALVPSEQHASDGHRTDDLYIFAFLTGLIAASQNDSMKAINAGQPAYLIHTLPKAWSNPITWQPISPITMKSESDLPIIVKISGREANRGHLSRKFELPPATRVDVLDDFYSIGSIHVNHLPGARLGIHSQCIGSPYIIDPFAWGNIWLYGIEIILTGYISYDEFGHRSKQIQPGSRVFQFSKTKTKNLAVPVADLKSLPNLFERVREWESDNK